MLVEKSDRERAKKYLKKLVGRIGKTTTNTDKVLYEEGISHATLVKYSSLHDGNQPQCLDTILKGPQFKSPNNAIMFPYSSNYELTHIAVAVRGGMQLFPVSDRPGAFLADELSRTVYVCRNEIDALILMQLNISATVLTAPSALTYDHFNIILIDSKGAPLPMGEVLEYKKLYQNVSVCCIPSSISEHRNNHPQVIAKTLEANTMDVYKWFAIKASLGYVHNQRRAGFELEDSEITKEELSLVIAELKKIPNSALVVDWIQRTEFTTSSVVIGGHKVIQSKAGWRFAGSDQMLTNFQLRLSTLKTGKTTKNGKSGKVDPIVSGELHVADGTVFNIQMPARYLWGTAPISNLLMTYFTDHAGCPKVECKDIPTKEISWLMIANAFHQYRNAAVSTKSVGFDTFSEMYNQIFECTDFKRPGTSSYYAKNGNRVIGFWHHKDRTLWLSQQRLLTALRELTGNNDLSREDVDRCFGKNVERVLNIRGHFFAIPKALVEVTKVDNTEVYKFIAG